MRIMQTLYIFARDVTFYAIEGIKELCEPGYLKKEYGVEDRIPKYNQARATLAAKQLNIKD